MSERPLVSVVIPMYNEAEVVERTLATVTDYLATLSDRFRFEVLVIDDGSTDETRKLVQLFAVDHPEVRPLTHRMNFRLGQALRFAFGRSRGDYVVTYDADMSYSVDHIGLLLDEITESGARIVAASPYMPGGKTYAIPFMRRVLSRGANWFLSLTATSDLRTITGLVRAYDGPFIRTLALKAVDVDVNTEIIYKAELMRARITEIPAVLDWRALVGRTRGRGFSSRLYWTTAKQLVQGFLFRPFMFFLIPGIVLSAVGLVLSLMDGATTVEMITLVLGIQLSALAGMTLQSKRYFEELYHLGTTLRRDISSEPSLQSKREEAEGEL